ncbi:hypothetical protein C8R48DRAFT_782979 [Suillus tomentosus]|nr:hypothetical protein C8R48DRAFT_782979 [Suillus tomentosus]
MSTAFSPDGGRVVSVLWDQTVWVWDIKIGEASGSLFQGHTDWVWFVTISLSPNIWILTLLDIVSYIAHSCTLAIASDTRELEVDELPPISNPLGCELNGSISNFEASNT